MYRRDPEARSSFVRRLEEEEEEDRDWERVSDAEPGPDCRGSGGVGTHEGDQPQSSTGDPEKGEGVDPLLAAARFAPSSQRLPHSIDVL